MKLLQVIFIFIILGSCGTSQNSGLEIFEAYPKVEQKRILEQIQPPLTYNYLKLLPFDGKSNFEDIDLLSKNVKSIKTIHRNYRIKKENWTVDSLAKLENQGTISELFFDTNQKIIKAIEYTAEDGITDEEIFKVNYYGGDKVISRERRKGDISYEYSDSIVTVTDKSDYNSIKIETHIRSKDSITTYFQNRNRPQVVKYEFRFNENNLLSNFRLHHGGGTNITEFFYNEKQQVTKYIQIGDHHRLDQPIKTKSTFELSYYDFGGLKQSIVHDDINNTSVTKTGDFSFEKNDNGTLIIKMKDKDFKSEFHLDQHNNLIYGYRELSKDKMPIAFQRIIEYY